MKLPPGFRAHGLASGLKPSGKVDLGLLSADGPLAWALTATRNRLVAPCVTRSRALLERGGPVRALIVNSGNANCATGDRGVRDDRTMAARTAAALGLEDPATVLTASTGVIGEALPVERIEAHLDDLAGGTGEAPEAFAEAILTTDLRTKLAEAELPGGARVVGVAKGSGMIHPNMATMLAFVTTDARIDQAVLRRTWTDVARRTFGQVTVDGDTSPNDMALALSSGRTEADAEALAEALETVCTALAERIAADGEGATTLLEVRVEGARDEAEALRAARAVAGSSLVKSAVHGRDPNWGRILSAIGAEDVPWDEDRVEIRVQDVTVFHAEPRPFDRPALSAAMDAERVTIHADLATGDGRGRAWGCDLSEEYVHINAEYTT